MTIKLPCFEGIPHNVIYDVACLGSTNPAPQGLKILVWFLLFCRRAQLL